MARRKRTLGHRKGKQFSSVLLKYVHLKCYMYVVKHVKLLQRGYCDIISYNFVCPFHSMSPSFVYFPIDKEVLPCQLNFREKERLIW